MSSKLGFLYLGLSKTGRDAARVALLGQSGAGKSSLCNWLAELVGEAAFAVGGHPDGVTMRCQVATTVHQTGAFDL